MQVTLKRSRATQSNAAQRKAKLRTTKENHEKGHTLKQIGAIQNKTKQIKGIPTIPEAPLVNETQIPNWGRAGFVFIFGPHEVIMLGGSGDGFPPHIRTDSHVSKIGWGVTCRGAGWHQGIGQVSDGGNSCLMGHIGS